MNHPGGVECGNSEDNTGETHPIRLNKPSMLIIEKGSHLGRRAEAIPPKKLIDDIHRQFKLAISHRDRCGVFSKGDTLLIGFSGGLRSLALLQCIKLCNSNDIKRKIHFKYHVLHVSDMILHETEQDHLEMNNYVNEICSSETNTFITFESVSINTLIPGYNEWMDQMPQTTHSERLDAKRFMLKRALEQFALSKGYKYVVLGTDATNMAITALSNLAIARPNISMLLLFRFKLSESSQVTFLQPLREILADEIAHYLYLQKVPLTKFGKFCYPDLAVKNSIQGITENFVAYLQQNYPSTVFTILRTVDKLKAENAQQQEDKICPICCENIITEKYQSWNMCMGCIRLSEFFRGDTQQFRKIEKKEIEEYLLEEKE
jgi:tRNA(Ile)-lysidine synthase TilS/MesJ